MSPTQKIHFGRVLPFLFRPRPTASAVLQKDATWLTPLLVVSLLLVARVWLSAPQPVTLEGEAGQALVPESGSPAPLPDESLPAEAENTGGGGLFPAVGAVLGLWLGWLLLGVLLFIGLVINGGQHTLTELLNLVAWTSLPLGVRQIVRLVTSLAAPSLAANPPGLAALAQALSGPGALFLNSSLALIDLYLVWQVILILLGLGQISNLPARRRFWIALGAIGLFLLLAALPGFFSGLFAQLTQPVPGSY